jgi:formate dehydrogenase major subunit
MEMRRRTFLGLAGAAGAAGAGGLVRGLFGIGVGPTEAYARSARPIRGKITTSICPFCSVGCGLLITAADGKVVGLTGDPDHPINEGALCSKGAAVSQIADSPERATRVLYRAPGATDWEEKTWEWALPRIAERVKATRDATFEERDGAGRRLNRTLGLASLGGSAMDNEECYLLSKAARALGMVYLEHHARL